MHPYPHQYRVAATARPVGDVTLSAANIPTLHSAPPVEFDGPGDQWSPETLLCSSVADCLVLTSRAIARAAHYDYKRVECRVEGTLAKHEGVAQFVQFASDVQLCVPAGADAAKGKLLVEKAKAHCLVANSLKATSTLTVTVNEEA